MKHVFPLTGAVLAVLALTSNAFAHHTVHQKVIAAVIIVGVSSLLGFLAARRGKPKAEAQPKPRSPYASQFGPRR